MDIDSFFSDTGPLAGALPGYKLRRAQLDMAHRVQQTLGSGGVLLAEAGTGTGKTLAYLVPALLANKKVVVSTATKTLQNQILRHDVPLLTAALGRPIAVVLLKGRQNYLCQRRFLVFRGQGRFRFAAEADLYDRLERWAGATTSGDRAEMEDLPDDYRPWREVCSTTDTCWGGRCAHQEDCHLQRARRAAQRAQVVVVNHHLFFADLAVRSSSSAEVLPRYAAVVLDEAHHLEAVATRFFGAGVSSYRVTELVRDASRLPGRGGGKGAPAPLAAALADAEAAAAALWARLPRTPTPLRLRGAVAEPGATFLGELLLALGHARDRLAPRQEESQEVEALLRRVEALLADLERFTTDPEPGEVRWLETRGKGTFLHAAPVEVDRLLAEHLFGGDHAVILTSATLTAGGSFAYLRERAGVPDGADEVCLESPFDHGAQGVLYVPREIPEPNSGVFAERALEEIARLLAASRGRAFCLFTSHRVLRFVAERLPGLVPYRLLVQGDAPREKLLEQFAADVHSVLLGAQSFWEGVDVPGHALSAVIIDRIPFASPGDPLVEARIERLQATGREPFQHYQLPAAAMALRQGAGRLLRRLEDRGVVAVLDRRLVERSYGRFLRATLPPFPLTREFAHVEAFFALPGAP
ncbi:MAG TPA: ATP-dependent DNA helicase [Deferrisomatales bacterium]|nr:ATP-dependent DNA helicase [Deferrisomatales bacterium]